MSMASSITSTTTPDLATAGLPAHSTTAPLAAPPKRPRWRFVRSLAAKVAVLALIFLAVPLIVYQRFSDADEAQKSLLLRSVRDQGRVMGQALMPLLSDTHTPAVKLLVPPADRPGFFYIASWPAVSSA